MTSVAGPAATIAAAMAGSVLLGAGFAAVLFRLKRFWLLLARQLLLAMLVPSLCLAVWPSVRQSALSGLVSVRGWPPLLLVLAALPVLLLPVVRAAIRLPSGQARAARGLGAGRLAALRFVWLPQFGPAILLGLAMAGLLDLAALRPGR